MCLAVDRDVMESVRPPRAGFYNGTLGSVAGEPNWPEHQRRVLDEALRWIEPMGQPGIRKLVVELESQSRGRTRRTVVVAQTLVCDTRSRSQSIDRDV